MSDYATLIAKWYLQDYPARQAREAVLAKLESEHGKELADLVRSKMRKL